MVILDSTVKSLKAVLSGAITTNQPIYNTSYVDVGVGKYLPGASDGAMNSAVAVTPVGAPGAGLQRQIKGFTLYNKDTVAITVQVYVDNNGTVRELIRVTLPIGATLEYVDTAGWRVVYSNGAFVTGPPIINESIRYEFNGGNILTPGTLIAAGIYAYLRVPFNCRITGATLLGDQAGSIVVDIWKDTYANYPPTIADTITAAAKPTLATAIKSQDTTLTGWTTTLNEGDILGINVDSVSTLLWAMLELHVTRT